MARRCRLWARAYWIWVEGHREVWQKEEVARREEGQTWGRDTRSCCYCETTKSQTGSLLGYLRSSVFILHARTGG